MIDLGGLKCISRIIRKGCKYDWLREKQFPPSIPGPFCLNYQYKPLAIHSLLSWAAVTHKSPPGLDWSGWIPNFEVIPIFSRGLASCLKLINADIDRELNFNTAPRSSSYTHTPHEHMPAPVLLHIVGINSPGFPLSGVRATRGFVLVGIGIRSQTGTVEGRPAWYGYSYHI